METVHKGHRDRIRKRFLDEGLSGFAPHEVLELLLFYNQPRGDMNPMAHALIEQNASVYETLHAPAEILLQTKGIGEKAARFLTDCGAIADRYAAARLSDKTMIDSLAGLRLFCLRLFGSSKENELWLLCLNVAGRLLYFERIHISVENQRDALRKIVKSGLLSHAKYVVLADYRREGEMAFTDFHIQFVQQMANILPAMDMQCADWVLMGQGKMLSLRRIGAFESLISDAFASKFTLTNWIP